MRKLTVLAMLAAVLIVGSAFAVNRHIQPNATFAFGAAGVAFGPSTTNNDDTCDISTAPAATLLLPFFDVDFKSPQTTARTTLFTITNVSNLPQIAHVVVWTDLSVAALDFNIFLTGYDVQAINLYDIFARGVIAPPSGTSADTTPGSRSAANTTAANPNIVTLASCTGSQLPGPLPPSIVTDLQSVFTTGRSTGSICSSTTAVLGLTHSDAIGYITIDVVNRCSTSLVENDFTYFNTTILFDNVLIGDYQDVNPNPATGNFAGGNPLVHIRAVPEGGTNAGGLLLVPPTNLPNTFYDRYTTNAVGVDRRVDRRQPLPSTFAARYIQGGTGQFNSNYKIWREGNVNGACTTSHAANATIPVTELVRFDEHENSSIASGGIIFSPPPALFGLPETSSQPTSGSVFPSVPSAAGDVGGWTFLNLNSGVTTGFSRNNSIAAAALANRASQNWVIVSFVAEGRFSVDFDSAWLGNGCSPPIAAGAVIGPAGGVLVCPPPLVRDNVQCAITPVGTNTTPP